jgi:hypothetical protein
MKELKNYVLIKFDGRGKAIKCMEALGKGLLQMWALQNTNGKSMTIIKEKDTDTIVMIVIGQGKNNFPKVIKDSQEIKSMGIVIEEV